MPELPEVETHARDLRRNIIGCPIKEVWVGWNKSIAEPSAASFKKMIVGKRFKKVTRRGKFIIMDLSGGLSLVSHFRMTGHFRLAPLSESESAKRWFILPSDRFSRVAFKLDKDEILHFSDIRKFGRLWLMKTVDVAQMPELASLGPEPLDKNFKKKDFIACVRRFKGMVKPVLLNQKCVAGIGNIYVDESLFDAGVHPETRVEKLSDEELGVLYKMVRANLAAGVKHRGSTVGEFINIKGQRGEHADYLRVYGKKGEPCQKTREGIKCSGKVKRIVVAQRGTHYCPACQKKR